MQRLLASLVAFLTLSGCTDFGVWLANAPVRMDKAQVRRDLAYGALPGEKFDLYYPRQRGEVALPVIVFFYGGAWQYGSKDAYGFLAAKLTARGYAVAIPDYRKYPAVKFPVFVEDGAASIAYLHEHARELGIDPERIYVMGHSAGAHIGALLAADPQYLTAHGGTRSLIRAFAGLAGPYDFTPEEQVYKDIFGPPENYPRMQVTRFVDGKQPPMLLLWGGDDTVVAAYNHERLAAGIKAEGGTVETHIYPDVGHIGILGSFSWLGPRDAPVEADIDRFFRTH